MDDEIPAGNFCARSDLLARLFQPSYLIPPVVKPSLRYLKQILNFNLPNSAGQSSGTGASESKLESKCCMQNAVALPPRPIPSTCKCGHVFHPGCKCCCCDLWRRVQQEWFLPRSKNAEAAVLSSAPAPGEKYGPLSGKRLELIAGRGQLEFASLSSGYLLLGNGTVKGRKQKRA